MLPDGYSDVGPGKIAAVVTHLEMRAPPPPRPDPAACELELRAVAAPAAAWYRELFRRVGEPWLWFSRLRLGEAELLAIIRHPAVEVFALVKDGREEGLLELDFRAAPACELAFLGVTAPLIGSGAGRFLMNRAIERAWRPGITRFRVHTCSIDHPGALGFYLRSGFVPIRRQIEIADDPRLTGEAPRSAAPHVPIL